jgi:hypothetical protein
LHRDSSSEVAGERPIAALRPTDAEWKKFDKDQSGQIEAKEMTLGGD